MLSQRDLLSLKVVNKWKSYCLTKRLDRHANSFYLKKIKQKYISKLFKNIELCQKKDEIQQKLNYIHKKMLYNRYFKEWSKLFIIINQYKIQQKKKYFYFIINHLKKKKNMVNINKAINFYQLNQFNKYFKMKWLQFHQLSSVDKLKYKYSYELSLSIRYKYYFNLWKIHFLYQLKDLYVKYDLKFLKIKSKKMFIKWYKLSIINVNYKHYIYKEYLIKWFYLYKIHKFYKFKTIYKLMNYTINKTKAIQCHKKAIKYYQKHQKIIYVKKWIKWLQYDIYNKKLIKKYHQYKYLKKWYQFLKNSQKKKKKKKKIFY